MSDDFLDTSSPFESPPNLRELAHQLDDEAHGGLGYVQDLDGAAHGLALAIQRAESAEAELQRIKEMIFEDPTQPIRNVVPSRTHDEWGNRTPDEEPKP